MQKLFKYVLIWYSALFVLSTIYALTKVELVQSFITSIETLTLGILFFKYSGTAKKTEQNQLLFLLLFVTFTIIHFTLNSNSDFGTFLKICSPFTFFIFGKSLQRSSTSRLHFNRNLKNITTILVCGLPLLVRLFQIVTKRVNGVEFSIFVNSNNYAYFLIVATCLLYALYDSYKICILYLLFGILTSQTLGALLALLISLVLVYYKKILNLRGLILSVFFIVFVSMTIYFSDSLIKTRLEGSYTTFMSLTRSSSGMSDLVSIDYGEAVLYAQGGDQDLSFLFRLKNWNEIIEDFLRRDFLNQMFGNGLMSVKKITSTHLVAHNDYLGILYELGIALFILITFAYFGIIRRIRDDFVKIFFYSIAIYHFTENLYYNFLVTSLHFLLLGIFYEKSKMRDIL